MKILDSRELAGFVKERQARVVRSLVGQGVRPKLVIVRDSNNPVIEKYVGLKKLYGEDIGVLVEDRIVSGFDELVAAVRAAGEDTAVHGVIVQLPLMDTSWTDEVVGQIPAEKDVDGLGGFGSSGLSGSSSGSARVFDSATAEAISWLLAGYNIDLAGKKIAVVGNGRLVGKPLIRMWRDSGYNVTVFDSKTDLSALIGFDVIVTATGSAHIIRTEYVRPGAVVVDAGTASEDGVLVGDLDEDVRERDDLLAVTPSVGGVGPLTISVLFEHVISAASVAVGGGETGGAGGGEK